MEYYDRQYNKNEPKEPFIKYEIKEEIAKDLNLLIDNWMQDWPYEVVNRDDIEKYLEYYNITKDDNKKFRVMEMLIQSVEEQECEENFLRYWNIIKNVLEKDFLIHEYTIWYWCLFEEVEEDDLDNAFRVTPFLRELWYKIKENNKNNGVRANGI
jgi:hypothetical protein